MRRYAAPTLGRPAQSKRPKRPNNNKLLTIVTSVNPEQAQRTPRANPLAYFFDVVAYLPK